MEEEIKRDKKVVWIVVFYTAWNPSCVNFAPIYAELSNQYGLDNLRFAKIDIGRYPEVARRFRVDDSSLSRQLPTLILFKDGKEHIRRPDIDTTNKIHKFYFSEVKKNQTKNQANLKIFIFLGQCQDCIGSQQYLH